MTDDVERIRAAANRVANRLLDLIADAVAAGRFRLVEPVVPVRPPMEPEPICHDPPPRKPTPEEMFDPQSLEYWGEELRNGPRPETFDS